MIRIIFRSQVLTCRNCVIWVVYSNWFKFQILRFVLCNFGLFLKQLKYNHALCLWLGLRQFTYRTNAIHQSVVHFLSQSLQLKFHIFPSRYSPPLTPQQPLMMNPLLIHLFLSFDFCFPNIYRVFTIRNKPLRLMQPPMLNKHNWI